MFARVCCNNRTLMCVNSLNGKVMYKKAAENLAVSNLCINTRARTHNSNYTLKLQQSFCLL